MIRPLITHVSNTSKIFVGVPSTGSFTSFEQVLNLYSEASKSTTNIYNIFNVPNIGSASVDISYTSKTVSSRDNILVDTTNTSSFWNDIRNWMYLNNFVDIVESGSNYYIDDNTNSSFLYIINNG